MQQSTAPTSLEPLAEWLRCPNCFKDLSPTAALTLGCANGHRFDVNKRGYATLVNERSTTSGDTLEMLTDRASLLGSGAYAPIADALVELVPTTDRLRVLDAGCGTGYYLGSVLDARRGSRGLAMDRSAAAVRIATRSRASIVGLVADTWQQLPIRDAVCDVVLNVFAPRNAAEFARVSRPDGALLVVVPRPDHLAELREETGMLTVPADKVQHVTEQLSGTFEPAGNTMVRYTLDLKPGHARLLQQMGPSAHHTSTDDSAALEAVTVSVDVIRFTRLSTPPVAV